MRYFHRPEHTVISTNNSKSGIVQTNADTILWKFKFKFSDTTQDCAALQNYKYSKRTYVKIMDTHKEIPDGGYGWVITLCSSINGFLFVGVYRCIGILILEWKDSLDVSIVEIAWIATAFAMFLQMTGVYAKSLLWHKSSVPVNYKRRITWLL